MRWTVGLFVTAAIAFAQADVASEIDRVVNGYVSERGFMGAVLAGRNGQVVLEKGYGSADLEWDIPSAADTKFRLGSITKQFTAAAVLQLAEAGKLKLDDSIASYVPECPEDWRRITVHHLLNHTSGIASYTNLPDFGTPKFRRVPLTPLGIVMLSRYKPLEFPPGAGYKYNNTGYVLLGHIIEKVSGQKYDEYLKQHIFDPLDMKDTGYDWTRPLLKKRAAGYGYNRQTKQYQNADFLDMSLPHAAGSLYSTVRDLYLWDRALRTERIVKKASLQKMFTPGRSNYGYGWVIDKNKLGTRNAHGGGINGFSTAIVRIPDSDAVVIVLSNVENSDAGAVANSVADTLFGEKVEFPWERKETPVDVSVLERYAGSYQIDKPKLTLTLTMENGRLMIQAPGQPKYPVFAESETKFFLRAVEASFEMTDSAQTMIFRQGGQELRGKRIP